MKTALKAIFTIGILCVLQSVYSQCSETKESLKKTSGAVGNSVAIELKNLSEKPVTIFTGRRDELKNSKAMQKTYAGLSTTTLYTSVNEVVCIMNATGAVVVCTDVKAGVTEIEIDASGSGINGK